MSILGDLKNSLFTRVSKNSTISTNNKKYPKYTTLFDRTDNYIPYELGCQILRDTQVSTGFDILKYLLSSKKWILSNSDETSTEAYDVVNDMLNNLETELNTIVKQLTSAIMWGFSVHELLFDVRDGYIVVTDLVPIHIKTLQKQPFIFDDNGDLEFIHQVTSDGDEYIPINKCLLYSYNSLYDEKIGHGLLYDFLPIVEDKENLMNWVLTFAERNGSPTMYGKTDNPTSEKELLKAFDDLADGTTGVVVGTEDDIGILESSHKGEVFFDTLAYKDNQIFRRMYIGNLLLGDNSQTGTYAQSQTQLEFGNMVFDGILEEIANIIQTQIINPITQFNFGDNIKAPVISFDKFTQGDMQKLFSIITPLMTNGTLDSDNSAVQESLALLFKSESGVEYTQETTTTNNLNEDFGIPPVEGETVTTDILNDLL